jgi:uncharacterized membrane protein
LIPTQSCGSEETDVPDSIETESHSRSLAKALSWRVFALAITTGISYILSNSITVAVSIGVVDSLIKIGAYYLHERAWMGIRFGRKLPRASEIV